MTHLAYQQQIAQTSRSVRWNKLDQLADWVVEKAIAVQQIPAPTFDELKRAEFVRDEFKRLGLEDVEMDERYNVYGVLRATDSIGPGLMVAAHTDTVFPVETDLTIKEAPNNLIYGPGLGDNSLAVSALFGIIRAMKEFGSAPGCDLYFVATSREEGLGDLGGMRMAFDRLKDKIKGVINMEGLAYGHIYNVGIAVVRLCITARAEGGHSWLHFGRESALHGLIELGAKITKLNPPENPRTTYNIGIVSGGHSINSIATEAQLWLDLRSEEREEVIKMEKQVRQFIQETERNDLTFEVDVVGDRPSGAISQSNELVQLAIHILGHTGIKATLERGSTDGNIPLSEGCPTVTIGITRGGNAHRLDEFIETTPVADGLKQAILLTLMASNWSG